MRNHGRDRAIRSRQTPKKKKKHIAANCSGRRRRTCRPTEPTRRSPNTRSVTSPGRNSTTPTPNDTTCARCRSTPATQTFARITRRCSTRSGALEDWICSVPVGDARSLLRHRLEPHSARGDGARPPHRGRGAVRQMRDISPDNFIGKFGLLDYAIAYGRADEARAALAEIDARWPKDAVFAKRYHRGHLVNRVSIKTDFARRSRTHRRAKPLLLHRPAGHRRLKRLHRHSRCDTSAVLLH